MTDLQSPPPEEEACLCRRYPSSQKGGTLIAEDVVDLAAHRRRLCDPDGYRPDGCPRCRGVLHVHDYRRRLLMADSEAPATQVIRYRCADRECGATWQVLPALLARHLWRSWRVVEQVALESEGWRPPVPARTQRRWQSRLACAARLLVVVLTTAAHAVLDALVGRSGLDARRRDLVAAYAEDCGVVEGERLAGLASLIHRLAPGVRVM